MVNVMCMQFKSMNLRIGMKFNNKKIIQSTFRNNIKVESTSTVISEHDLQIFYALRICSSTFAITAPSECLLDDRSLSFLDLEDTALNGICHLD
jgi:hypothetical protein